MRYIIADEDHDLWGHLFEEYGRDIERMCRFVYDTQDEALHKLEVQRDHRWQYAAKSEMDDLEDSLKTANAEALDNPEAWGLGRSETLPDWANPDITPGL